MKHFDLFIPLSIWLWITVIMAVIDLDGSLWRNDRALRAQWAAALVACVNGESFRISNRIVLCDVTDVHH